MHKLTSTPYRINSNYTAMFEFHCIMVLGESIIGRFEQPIFYKTF